MLTLAFTGDVMLGRYVNEMLKTMQPEEVWGDVLPHLAQANLQLGDQAEIRAYAYPDHAWRYYVP